VVATNGDTHLGNCKLFCKSSGLAHLLWFTVSNFQHCNLNQIAQSMSFTRNCVIKWLVSLRPRKIMSKWNRDSDLRRTITLAPQNSEPHFEW
jgi:hypothetical protein